MNHRTALGALHIGALFFGLTGVFGKLAATASPAIIVFGRAAFAVLALALFASLAGPLRPLGETLARVRDDERERGVDRERRSGLTPTEERGVLAALGRA